MLKDFTNGNSIPKLYIVEDVEDTFRFRYSTEVNGTHGSLMGENTQKDQKIKTFPQVRLEGYRGKAVIRYSLYQENLASPHPHSLVIRDDAYDKCDPHYHELERSESGTLNCKGMGIIHTSKKDMIEKLSAKLEELYQKDSNAEIGPAKRKEFMDRAKSEAKTMNLNKVSHSI